MNEGLNDGYILDNSNGYFVKKVLFGRDCKECLQISSTDSELPDQNAQGMSKI